MASITQLEYLLAVEEEKHFGRAAQKCHVAQPSLSIQIQKLEEELETVIFDRSRKPIRISEEGRAIVEQARVILKEHKKLFTLAEEGASEARGEFHLAVIPTLSPYLIPLFLGKFSQMFPKVELKIREAQTEDIIRLLKSDQIDGGLLVTPLQDEQIIERHLFFEPFYAYFSKQHSLLKKSRLKDSDLNGEDLWLLEEGHCFRNQMLNVCSIGRDNRVMANVEFSSGSLETLVQLVKKNDGFTLLPELAVTSLSAAEKKQLRGFSKPVPTREVSLVHSRSFLKEKILQSLETCILDSIPKEVKSLKKGNINVVDIKN
ncbi:MAG: LysR substrate-binding domain-containing protein [Bdellovibrionota bacterium]|jgi:LysR family hydrogen peroxide-inducible transcriptional activator|nr:LysR substrate-binding domain-containing protein [Bdellovibrionota bacterium]